MLDIDAYSDHGLTALHVAIVHGHHEIAELLIVAGANKDCPVLPCIVDGCNEQCKVAHDCKVVHPTN